MNNRVYFDNDVHDELIKKVSLLMMRGWYNPHLHELARDVHQTLLTEYEREVIDCNETETTA